MRRDEVADEQEDAHDHMLGDRHDVRTRDFENLEAFFNSSIQVDVVRTDTCGHAKLEVLGLDHSQQSGFIIP